MSPPSTSRVRRRSVGAEAEVCPGRTRLIASWALACGRLKPRLLQHRAAVGVETRGHGYAALAKSELFSIIRRGTARITSGSWPLTAGVACKTVGVDVLEEVL